MSSPYWAMYCSMQVLRLLQGVIKSTTLTTPPMSKQWGLHMHEHKRLPEQRIVEMTYCPTER